MQLNQKVCSRARLARDPRFDGRFFIAVRTTGVYCRPICPVRAPKEENVRYFPSAAAAAEAGFRPCLRCRPECSPGTPAWRGTSATVSRALRLINEAGLEEAGVDGLAARLGIGTRHLRRLFLKHLGASPIAVVQTRRLHFAKKLIDDTALPMNQVALASGFGSLRRFNATFHNTYRRTPTQLRRLHRVASPLPENEYHFQLRFRPPFDWDALLEFLAFRAIPGTELVSGGHYRRIFSLKDNIGWIDATLDQSSCAISLRIRFPAARLLVLIVEQVRRLFDLEADTNEIARHLSRDPLLKSRIAAQPGLRVPGCWDGFELAVRAILGQQVTVRGASTLAGRLVRAFGKPVLTGTELTHLFPSPTVLSKAELSSIGLPRARAQSIRELARAVRDGEISFSGVVDPQEFLARFRHLPGIGAWTAQYVAMRALGEPDAFPASDLGLLRATGLDDYRQLEKRAEDWRPWRAYAALYLWQGVTNGERSMQHANEQSNRSVIVGGGRTRPARYPLREWEGVNKLAAYSG
jgi:AraC family transcriptional regulator, regulatory protein of adaptative response / DNA-3-methyladenine glycosylase II